jgi:hypothetical protein
MRGRGLTAATEVIAPGGGASAWVALPLLSPGQLGMAAPPSSRSANRAAGSAGTEMSNQRCLFPATCGLGAGRVRGSGVVV